MWNDSHDCVEHLVRKLEGAIRAVRYSFSKFAQLRQMPDQTKKY